MTFRAFALVVLAASSAAGALFAQDAPLPQVRRQPAPIATVSTDCNEPPVPDQKEPVSAPVIITEEETAPARAARQRERATEPEFAPVEQPIPGAAEISTAEAIALVRETAQGGLYEDFAAALAIARRKVSSISDSRERRAFNDALEVYSDLNGIWKYAVTDPIGAFYNNATLPGAFTRLSGKYPGYVEFIAPLSVTDSAGNQFYPTTETRRFLAERADRALRGIRLPAAPTGVIAERGIRPAPEARRETPRREPRVAEQPAPRRPTAARPRPAPQPRRAAATPPRRTAPSVRRPRRVPRAEPVVTPEEPEPIVAEPAPSPAPSATVPEPAPAVARGTRPEEPAEPPSIATSATAVTPPPAEQARPASRRPAEDLGAGDRRGLSGNTLVLIAFALIALIAIALMARAMRASPAVGPILTDRPEEPRPEEPSPADADWIDPETRHWIEDVNKQDKPPN